MLTRRSFWVRCQNTPQNPKAFLSRVKWSWRSDGFSFFSSSWIKKNMKIELTVHLGTLLTHNVHRYALIFCIIDSYILGVKKQNKKQKHFLHGELSRKLKVTSPSLKETPHILLAPANQSLPQLLQCVLISNDSIGHSLFCDFAGPGFSRLAGGASHKTGSGGSRVRRSLHSAWQSCTHETPLRRLKRSSSRPPLN